MSKPKPRLLVVFSDTHCGSRLAMLPPTYQLMEDDVIIKATPTQMWLNSAWDTLWQQVHEYIGKDPWSVALVGDLIEGCHHGRRELVSNELSDHIEIFCKTVGPKIENAVKKYFVLGTEVHGGATEEMVIAKKYGATRHPDTKRWAENRWHLELNGYPVVLRHHIEATSREYLRASQLAINLANEQLAAIKRGHRPPNGLIVAHRHMHDYYTDGNNFCLVCGPWQMTTRFGHRKWSPMIPEPTLTVIDYRITRKGEMPIVTTFKATPGEATYAKI